MRQPPDGADDADRERHALITVAQLLTFTTQMLVRDLGRDGTSRDDLTRRAAAVQGHLDALLPIVERHPALVSAASDDGRRQDIQRRLSEITGQVTFIVHRLSDPRLQRQAVGTYAAGLYRDVIGLLLLLEPDER